MHAGALKTAHFPAKISYTTQRDTIANQAFFEYIDGFYNTTRIQKRLGYLSPIEYEEKFYAEQAAAERVNRNTQQPITTS
ncbi:IS3 family transposase [Streptomyces sp. NPDC098789]|uniref:IS3 family transposase n=1 Tax=Streptomyces sp. NPDC098789 TaxID=3366098 RepID=UPI003828728B